MASNDGRPSDGGRPNDDARGTLDGAVFAPRSVRASGGIRSWLVAIAGFAVVGGLVMSGLLSPASLAPDLPSRASALAAVPATPAATAEDERSARTSGEPLTGPGAVVASTVRADVQADGRYVFVHGEVYSSRVVEVVVALQNRAGRTKDARRVHLPAGSTAFRIGAVDRFEVQFERPTSRIDASVTIEIVCYDETGEPIATITRLSATDAAG